ncbi:GcrA family cell cycle regulator [Roseomonas sp. BN140053]|uniref:GcrA family cell cycle regulator n=1 Tax=Roseomonas sp. BN140053 TaxID=3391898 RepID=UPI0039ED67B9
MEWTAEAIDALQALWAEGHSTAEIGRRMGISKNAVVGKAHRLNLSARPSPIRREDGAARAAQPAPAAAEARRPVEAPQPQAAPPPPAVLPTVLPAAVRAERPAAPRAAPAPVVRSFQRMGGRSCCWPLGEPGTPEFRFCTAEAAGGRPYCAEHASIAYVKSRDRREDAA